MGDSRTIHRHEIPVDGAWHQIELSGPILHVDCRDPRTVDIWTLHNDGEPTFVRELQVFGTGSVLAADAGKHIGTALSPAMPPVARRGALVWHVFERSTSKGA